MIFLLCRSQRGRQRTQQAELSSMEALLVDRLCFCTSQQVPALRCQTRGLGWTDIEIRVIFFSFSRIIV